jgi:curved DNA-binding protein CbpA
LLLVVRNHLPAPTKPAEASWAVGQFGRLINFYRVLGLRPGADGEKIKAAYRRLVKRFHPDINAGDTRATQRTKDIIRAYQTLGEPEARAAYDIEFARQRSEARRRFLRSMGAGVAASLIIAALLFPFLAKPDPTILRDRTRESHFPADKEGIEPKSQLSPTQAYRAPPEDRTRASSLDGEDRAAGKRAAQPMPREERAGSRNPVVAMPSEVQRPAVPSLEGPADPAPPPSVRDQRPRTEPTISPGPAVSRAKPATWVAYTNARLGFTLRYPADVFESGKGVDSDDRLLTSRDGRALLRIFATTNRVPTTIAEYRRSLIAQRYAAARFDYTPQRQDWFVLSGSVAQEMFYERVTFSCDRRSIHGWVLVYPLAERSYFDAIVEEIHRSYRYTAGRCGESEPSAPRPTRDGKSRPAGGAV